MPHLTGHQAPVIPPSAVDFANKRMKARKSACPRPSWDVPTAFEDNLAASRTAAATARMMHARVAQRHEELIVTGPRRVTPPKHYQDGAGDVDDMYRVKSQGRARDRATPRASAPSATRRGYTNGPERPHATQPQQAAPVSGPVPESPQRKMPLKPGGPCHACACTASPLWRRGKATGLYADAYFCNACGTRDKRHGLDIKDLGQKVDNADEEAVNSPVRRKVKVSSRVRGRAAARAGEDLTAAVASMRGRSTGQGRAVGVTMEGREPRSDSSMYAQQQELGLRQGLQAHKNPELMPSDSSAAKIRRKRAADILAGNDNDQDLTAPQAKVFRLHAFGGETARAPGRMQLLQKQHAAQAARWGNADGADLDMAMSDDDSDDRSSNDAAATLMGMGTLHMLQRRGTVAARGKPASAL